MAKRYMEREKSKKKKHQYLGLNIFFFLGVRDRMVVIGAKGKSAYMLYHGPILLLLHLRQRADTCQQRIHLCREYKRCRCGYVGMA